jgi:hypothetical protein
VILDRGDLAIEIMVQNVDDGLGRQPIRQRREAAQVGQPDRRIHVSVWPRLICAAHDALAGAVADIGIQQARSHAVQLMILDHPRQRLHDAPQRRQLLFGEPARLFGGPARSVHRAADEGQRQRDIVRHAFGAEFLDDRKAAAPDLIGPRPNLHPLLEHDDQRTGEKIRRLQDVVVHRADLDLGARLPDEIAPVDLGMQRADEYADTPERQTRRDHPFAAFRHELAGLAADLPPSISQSVSSRSFDASMRRYLPRNPMKGQAYATTTGGVT